MNTYVPGVPRVPPWKKRSVGGQTAMYVLLVLPALGTLVAVWLALRNGIDPFFPIMTFVLYALTGLGITVGYHRHFTHESFQTHQWIRAVLGVFGHMAIQGPASIWCAKHYTHHTKSDKPGLDPHTPLECGGGIRGFWHAHFGWLLYDQPVEHNDVWNRLRDDPVVRWLDDHALLWVVLSFVLPTVLGYAYTNTWEGALLGLLWGGGVRLFVVQHATWLVNSATHVWGKRRFGSKNKKLNDESRDNWFVALVAFGEGWHNFHHVFMKSAVHGYDHPWLDPSYVVIRTLKACGLAWSVWVPTPATVDPYRISSA